jgi:hypothetical protein
MRLSCSLSCIMFLAGCASHSALPAASATGAAASVNPDTGVEVRHMYLVAPGKDPVLIVDRDDGSSTPQEVSSEPPTR